jgi:DNA-directed RNA polymerase specialized sigma24 family protein
MKRTEFFQLTQPLTERLYRFAFALLPDDLQAEQLVVDALNAYLLKEKKTLLARKVNIEDRKEVQLQRRQVFKAILRTMSEIGVRRAIQMNEQMKLSRPEEYKSFYALEPKVRFAMKLRYEGQFNVEEIEDILQVPRYEVIEKLHNGRFLLISDLNSGVSA